MKSLMWEPARIPAGGTSREWPGCPCPVAGRSLRPSGPPLTRSWLRFAILGCAGQLRRLPGHEHPCLEGASRGQKPGRACCQSEGRVDRRRASGRGVHAPSPDVRCGPPGLHSLEAGCASPSLAALASYAVSRGMSTPAWKALLGRQAARARMAVQPWIRPPARMAGSWASGCTGHDGRAAVDSTARQDGGLLGIRLHGPRWPCSRTVSR
jgi:hypothetical protein